MRRLFLLVPALGLLLAVGCGDPCEKLEKKICAQVESEHACERSKKDMEDFSEEVCAHALEIYERLYED